MPSDGKVMMTMVMVMAMAMATGIGIGIGIGIRMQMVSGMRTRMVSNGDAAMLSILAHALIECKNSAHISMLHGGDLLH